MATTFTTGFETNTVGALPAGWTGHVSGPQWAVDNNLPLVGLRSLKCPAGANSEVVHSSSAARTDSAVQYTTRVYKFSSSFGSNSPTIRSDATADDFYSVIINWVANTAQFYRVNTALGSSFAVPNLADGTLVKIKMEAQGTTIRFKVWAASGSEPVSFTSTVTDSGLTTGRSGARFVNGGFGQGAFDEYFEGDVGTTFGTPSQTIAPNNSSIFYSPWNWQVDASAAISPNPGAYIKFPFTGSQWVVNLDSTSTTITVEAKVDQYNWKTLTLVSGANIFTVQEGLPAGSHLGELRFLAALPTNNRWGTSGVPPTEVVKITSYSIDTTGAMGTYVPFSKKLLIYSDSIGEGQVSAVTSNNSDNWIPPLAYALDAEYGTVAFGGQGFINGGQGSPGPPGVNLAWTLKYAGVSRVSSGLLVPQPDILLSTHGVNSAGATTSAIAAQFTAWRGGAPNARIIQVIPFGQQEVATITTAFTNYQAATPDPKAHLINLGTDIALGLNNTGNVTFSASDGLHPRLTYTPKMATKLAVPIYNIVNPSAPGGGGINGSPILQMP